MTVVCLPEELRAIADKMDRRIANWQPSSDLLVETIAGYGGSVEFVIDDVHCKALIAKRQAAQNRG